MKPLFVLLLATACSLGTHERIPDGYQISIANPGFQGTAMMHKLSVSKGFKIVLLASNGHVSDQIVFKYPLYQLDTADVNRDGNTDILVGLVKPTEFNPQPGRRLFILRIDEGHLRPLWLGSSVCQELVDFKTLDRGVVQTLEKTNEGNFAIGLYEWQGFGLTLIRYVHNEITQNEASAIFLR